MDNLDKIYYMKIFVFVNSFNPSIFKDHLFYLFLPDCLSTATHQCAWLPKIILIIQGGICVRNRMPARPDHPAEVVRISIAL
jgi:hypothetical protein